MAIQQLVGPERRELEDIADFQLPIVDVIRAARSTLTLCRLNPIALHYLVTKFSWAVGLVFAGWEHYGWMRQRSKVLSKEPELADSYDRVMWGNTIFYSLPFVVMGIGILSGGVGNVFDFLRPRSGNVFVLAFYFVIVASTLSLSVWALAFGGALYLSPHMKRSPTLIKLQLVGVTAWVLFCVTMLFLWRTAT